MAQSAKVLSVQALKDFKLSLINFVEESRNALSGVDMELKRMRDWLERDQLSYWQMQVKRRHEAMMMARTELHRRKISQQGSDAVSDTEQKEALREAQRRLHKAEEKVELVKKLIPIFHHAMAEYISRATPLADHLSGGVDKSLGSLEKMIGALEAYLATAPPSTPLGDEGGGGSSAAMTSARAGGPVTESKTGTSEPSDVPAGAASQESASAASAAPADDAAAQTGGTASPSKPQAEASS
jgi:hypothetical protein